MEERRLQSRGLRDSVCSIHYTTSFLGELIITDYFKVPPLVPNVTLYSQLYRLPEVLYDRQQVPVQVQKRRQRKISQKANIISRDSQHLCYILSDGFRLSDEAKDEPITVIDPKGTIYAKCDSNGNMLVRLLMNEVFGKERFLSEVIWRRFTGTKSQFKSFSLVTDTIYACAKSSNWIYEQQFAPYDEKYLKWFNYEDKRDKYLLRNFYSPSEGLPRNFFGKLIPPPKGHRWS